MSTRPMRPSAPPPVLQRSRATPVWVWSESLRRVRAAASCGQGTGSGLANSRTVLGYRYVLILESGLRHHAVRQPFQALREGVTVSTARYGNWVVRNIVESDDPTFTDGLAHCEPAEGEEP